MAGYYAMDFPYESKNGYPTAAEAIADGWAPDQIWSVAYCGTTTTYGPPHHTLGIDHYLVTEERHDGDTYYEEDDGEPESE